MSRQREEIKEVGDNALKFFENFIKLDKLKKYDYRTIAGILSLRKEYSDEIIDAACLRAISYDAYSYKVVKRICEKRIINLPVQSNESYTNHEETALTRNLKEYDRLSDLGELK